MINSIKVLIADDHTLFRAGVIKLLNEHDNIQVVGEAENGEELIAKYFDQSPDIILADIAMPGMTGTEAVSRIKEKDKSVKALFLSMYEGEEYIYKVLKCGGVGLINKSILEDELIFALERVFGGDKYFNGEWDELSLQKLVNEFESSKKSTIDLGKTKLNFREEQILKFINEGLSSKEMAEKLNLSKKTIDFYRSCLMKKFDLKSPYDLIRLAAQKYPFENNQP